MNMYGNSLQGMNNYILMFKKSFIKIRSHFD